MDGEKGVQTSSAGRMWARLLRARRYVAAGAAGVVVVSAGFVGAGTAAAAGPCDNPVNAIVAENCLSGSPSEEWDVWGAGDDTIQGFATDISVNAGQRIDFKISTTASAFTVDIYRLGYYGGAGARKVATVNPSVSLPQNQPACVTNPTTSIYDCGTWSVSAFWNVPSSAVSGVYIARPKRTDNGGASHIPFVVRKDSSTSDLFFQTSDTTWHAYNDYGGANFYHGTNGRAYKLSYNRPFATRGGTEERDFLFANEYPTIRFLERNGYDVSYTTDMDSDRRGHLIRNHNVFLSVGHDEYWSKNQRANVEAARDAGTNLAFLTGNESYWKTRWETSQDGSNTPYRTLVCYKETWANEKIDPSPEWTGTWRDPRFSPPADGGVPENALTGTAFRANHLDLDMTVKSDEGKLRAWRNTGLNAIPAGQLATLAPHTVGYESNEDMDNGFRPAGLIRLSTTVGPSEQLLVDYGTVVEPGITTHHMTLYRAASGALVFSTGTIQFAWGLDAQHDGVQSPADPRMQQFLINMLAEMDSQPATLMSGMVAASKSTDTTAPTATFTSPASGASVVNGEQATVTGTASDTGGRVAGVEVSTDGGATWHAAEGTTSWSYTFYAGGVGTQTVRARAMDDSANIGVAATRQLTLTGPSSLFGTRAPKTAAANDSGSVELGVKVTPTSDGTITGVRFYKGTGNTGTHIGSLWSTNGTRLATGTFQNETTTGWQTLTFGTPVQVDAGTTYVASYYAPNGRYAADAGFFSGTAWSAPPLNAPRSSTAGGNGVFRSGPGFPASSYADTNYWVDVMFVEGAQLPPSVVSTWPSAGGTNVGVIGHPSATFSKSMNPSSIVFTLVGPGNTAVPGTVSYDSATKKAVFTPTQTLTAAASYTASVMGSDTAGTPMAAPTVWSFTTVAVVDVYTLFNANATPAVASANDSNAVTLGVRFTASANGSIYGVRYYQGPDNVGTHTGSLYSATGTLLARATFEQGGDPGWQTVYFSSPVSVTANTTYVAAYYAPNGGYSVDSGFFNSAWTNGPLSAPAGTNGVYRYGGDDFPSSAWNSTNYWVDPIYVPSEPLPPPPSPPTPPSVPSGAETIFAETDTPSVANWNDNSAITVGVRFTSDVAGSVAGVRFYKGATNTGTHTGSLWSASGTLLATGTFIETASGWQTLLFDTPVAITAGTTYVASYHTTVGKYAATVNAFASGHDNAPLHVVSTGGAYVYGSSPAFPSNGVNHNYWVDVILMPTS